MEKGDENEQQFVGLVTDASFRVKVALHCAHTRGIIYSGNPRTLTMDEVARIGKNCIDDR